ncbi:hypothetical protein GH714_037043 [Hevea brasiliensis]|uniref:Peptidase M50 domain-containing protein n=1 Tax=Hevea brasiliensis TaxID=3981 RepID=A0A6A6L7J7_HEVBR|nr:hypothetical protein GH714_037043 [Hevea brasiliensis]
MSILATFRGNFSPLSSLSSQYSSCSHFELRSRPFLACSVVSRRKKRCRFRDFKLYHVSRFHGNRGIVCRVTETQTEPDSNNDKEKEEHEGGEATSTTDSIGQSNSQPDSQPTVVNQINNNDGGTNAEGGTQDPDALEVASGSPLPGVKGGVLFKGNLRGQAAKSYEKIANRMQNKFGDEYKLFLLVNPEDDKPVAVVVPRKTLQPETTAVPEWFAAGAFGVVTVFTLLLRNVPALQSNLLSTFDNLELLKNGLPGALVSALILGVHELSHILVAKRSDVKLGVPYFVPSWQIGSFGAITRILSIVSKREDLLKVAAAGPIAGFTVGFVLFLLGFILPPSDGVGLVVDASVFHESFLAGGIALPVHITEDINFEFLSLFVAKLLLGDVLKEGELDGGRISFAIWGRKASARFTAVSIVLLGLSSLFNDVAFYWVFLIFFLQRGPIAPLAEEITDPDEKYVALGVLVLLLGLLVCLPYPFPFTDEVVTNF